MSKSAKHRALARSRQEAIKAGNLPEWYEARRREAAEAASFCELTEIPAVRETAPTPYTPSPAFARAYAASITHEGASWSEDSRYMRWTLPVSSGSNRPTPPRNF
jgi:hypothetical protein